MNFCKDCKHARKTRDGRDQPWGLWECGSPKNPTEVNLVNGEATLGLTFCVALRVSSLYCGPEGRWFSAKDSSVSEIITNQQMDAAALQATAQMLPKEKP